MSNIFKPSYYNIPGTTEKWCMRRAQMQNPSSPFAIFVFFYNNFHLTSIKLQFECSYRVKTNKA